MARDERQRLAVDARHSTRQITRLTEAITLGADDVPELAIELQKAHARRQGLARRLELGHPDAPRAPVDWAAVESEGRSVLRNWRDQLAGQPAEARAVLRELLEGRRIRFTPVDEPHERGYRFAGDAGVGGLLDGAVLARVASVQDPVGTNPP